MCPVPDDLTTPKAIAALLRCHPGTVYRLIQSRRLPAYRRGCRYLVSRAAALALLEPLPADPPEVPDPRDAERRHAAALELLRAQGYRV